MENLSTKRDKIIKSLFQNELSNIQEELDAIKEAGTNLENVCSQINWDAKDLEGKTKEEVDIINSIRKFIQDLFNEYQIRSTAILAKKTQEYEGLDFDNDSDRKNAMLVDLQKESSVLLIEMFVKCINHCNKEEHQNAFNYYKQDLEQIENLYIDIKKKNKELENRLWYKNMALSKAEVKVRDFDRIRNHFGKETINQWLKEITRLGKNRSKSSKEIER